MPTYTYRCSQCANTIDLWQKISDTPLGTCPRCQGSLRRVPYPVGIMFKGSGFYSTDSRAHQSTSQTETVSTAS